MSYQIPTTDDPEAWEEYAVALKVTLAERDAARAERDSQQRVCMNVIAERDALREALAWTCDDYEAERSRADTVPPLSVLSARRVLGGEQVKPRNVQTREYFDAALGNSAAFRGYNDPGHDTDWPCPHHRAPEFGCEPCADELQRWQGRAP